METLTIPATALTPAVDFDYSRHRLTMRGESYPENVGAFYGPVLTSLQAYLAEAARQRVAIGVELMLTYINSASTKSIQQLLAMLDAAAKAGAAVSIEWIVDPEDDALTELGQDLLQDKAWLRHSIVRSTPNPHMS